MLLKKEEEDLKSTRVVDLRRFLPFTCFGGAGSLARCGFFSSVAIWGDHSLQCVVFSVVPSLVWRLGSRVHGLSYPEACGIFLDQASVHVPGTGGRIRNLWTTREVQISFF